MTRPGGSAWPGACALERGRRGVSGERAGEHSRPGIEHGGRQRLSAAAGACAACLNACARRGGESAKERERREKKGVEREKRKSTV